MKKVSGPKALKNGWLVYDIPMLMRVFEAVKSMPYGEKERNMILFSDR